MADRIDAKSLPESRSAGARPDARPQQSWPPATPLRILSLDGGGLKGIYAAQVIAHLEEKLALQGRTHRYFDYIVGTSTGATIGLALAIGMPARDIVARYVEHGAKIFPTSLAGVPRGWLQLGWHPYRHEALELFLADTFGDRKLGDLLTRTCVPSCDGSLAETWIFKTPHHEDFKSDWKRSISEIARASSAAPTYLRPLQARGYAFLDGGLYANNPAMVGIADALGCYDIAPRQIRLLSIGSGGKKVQLGPLQRVLGGQAFWAKKIADTMIDFSVQNAKGQAQLIIGHDNAVRLEPGEAARNIEMTDYARVMATLPVLADATAADMRERLAAMFYSSEVAPPKFFYGARALQE